MFTGIIKDFGLIIKIQKSGDWEIEIQPSWKNQDIDLGSSISCSGICLTVKKFINKNFIINVSHETISKTNISDWTIGTKINLEKSLKIGDELGGHFVTGHIDGLAKVHCIEKINDSHKIIFTVPSTFMKYIVQKGSITLNGVSLTVNEVYDNKFSVNIIDYTWNETTFNLIEVSQCINFEIDIISRYLLNKRKNY